MTTRTDEPDWFHSDGHSDTPDASQATIPDGTEAPTLPDPGIAAGHASIPVLPDRAAMADAAPDGPVVDGGVVDEGDGGGQESGRGYDDDLLDDWQPRRVTNRLTVVLAAAAVGACMFTAGALVQKQFGDSGGTTATAFPTGVRNGTGAPTGFPGGFPGQDQAQQGQAGQGQAGQGRAGRTGGGAASSSGPSGGASTGSSDVPVVVGTVKKVQGKTLMVENFAGKSVTVTVPASATVTAPGLTGVAVGMTVSVVGKTGADGAVTATSVTARAAS